MQNSKHVSPMPPRSGKSWLPQELSTVWPITLRWKRVSRNKIVAACRPRGVLVQLTRYKSSRVAEKGTWKMVVITVPTNPLTRVTTTHLTLPLHVAWPSDAKQVAEAYITAAQSLGTGPLAKLPPMKFVTD